MVAAFITIYTIGFLGMAGLILVMMSIGAMFGSLPSSDIWKAFAFAAFWPVLIVWGFANWTVHKIRN